MILMMAMRTIAGPAYSSVVVTAKLELEYQLYPGYAGPRPAIQKV
jgi:hypothetical protein